MSRSIRRILLAFLCGLAVLPAGAGAADPFEGTWELDLAKSTFKPGPPNFKTQTRVMTIVPEGIHLTVDATLQNGGGFSGSGIYRADGKDYPFKGVPGLDSIALTKTGDRVHAGIAKREGRPVMHITFTISDDGRVHTVQARTVDGAAQPFDNTLVFNRK